MTTAMNMLMKALEEYEGYDKHGGVEDTLGAARLLAKSIRALVIVNLSEERTQTLDSTIHRALSA